MWSLSPERKVLTGFLPETVFLTSLHYWAFVIIGSLKVPNALKVKLQFSVNFFILMQPFQQKIYIIPTQKAYPTTKKLLYI